MDVRTIAFYCREFQRYSYKLFRRLMLLVIERVPLRDLLLRGMRSGRNASRRIGDLCALRSTANGNSSSSGPVVPETVSLVVPVTVPFVISERLSPEATDMGTILFISHDAGFTGAPILLLSLMRWLSSATELHLRAVLRHGGPLAPEFQKICDTFTVSGNAPNDIQNLRRFVVSSDVRLIYSNTAVCGDILQWLADLNVPTISHIHELEMGIELYGGKGLFELVKANTDHYIAASRAVYRNLIANHGLHEDSVSVIYEWMEDDRLLADEEARSLRSRTRKELGIPDAAFVVGACGTIDWRKGPDLFVQLAREIVISSGGNDVYFLWIGAALESVEYKQLIHEVVTCGLDSRIHFLGTTATPLSYFSCFDVFALTSREDPFPLVCLEALSLGVPVICFEDAGGMPELLSDGCGSIVPYLDVPSMGREILELKANPGKLKRLGMRGAELIRSRHLMSKKGPEIRDLILRFLEPGCATRDCNRSEK
jgi:glycosyltransferase involved in cell wall biosynthesis